MSIIPFCWLVWGEGTPLTCGCGFSTETALISNSWFWYGRYATVWCYIYGDPCYNLTGPMLYFKGTEVYFKGAEVYLKGPMLYFEGTMVQTAINQRSVQTRTENCWCYCRSPHLKDSDNKPTCKSISMVVMEYVDGDTLAKAKQTMDEGTIETVRSEVRRALKLLHDNGLVFWVYMCDMICDTSICSHDCSVLPSAAKLVSFFLAYPTSSRRAALTATCLPPQIRNAFSTWQHPGCLGEPWFQRFFERAMSCSRYCLEHDRRPSNYSARLPIAFSTQHVPWWASLTLFFWYSAQALACSLWYDEDLHVYVPCATTIHINCPFPQPTPLLPVNLASIVCW